MLLKWRIVVFFLAVLIPLLPATHAEDDPFASWFVDQHKESDDSPTLLSVQGQLPNYIHGNLIRLGPTILNTPKKNYTNYLDGFGRVSKWGIDGASNKVTYQSRIIRSLQYNASNNAEDIVRHITQEPTEPKTHIGKLDIVNMDNTDVALYTLGDDESVFVTVTDFVGANLIDMRTLRTIGSFDYNDDECAECKGSDFSGSHNGEWTDPLTNEVNIVNWLGKKTLTGFDIYIYTMSPTTHKRRIVGSVSLNWQPYSIHSIAVSGDKAALILGHVGVSFVETGAELCLSCAAKDKLNQNPTYVYVFDLSGSNIGVKTKPIVSLEIPKHQAFFVFHYINAKLSKNSEDGHEVFTMDTCAYDSMEGVLGDHVLGNLHDALTPSIRDTMPYNCDALRRLKIDLTDSSILELTDLPVVDAEGIKHRMELVSINPTYWGRSACFGYGFTMHVHGSPQYNNMGIGKVNLCAPEDEVGTINVFHQDNVYVGEPLFVPSPGGNEEDDGALLVVSKDGTTGDTNLLVIDAKTMEVVATVKAPFPTMYEFHGKFIPST